MLSAIRFMYTLVRVRFDLDERGQDMVEYALLTGFIAVAFVAAAVLLPLQSAFDTMLGSIQECVNFDSVCP